MKRRWVFWEVLSRWVVIEEMIWSFVLRSKGTCTRAIGSVSSSPTFWSWQSTVYICSTFQHLTCIANTRCSVECWYSLQDSLLVFCLWNSIVGALHITAIACFVLDIYWQALMDTLTLEEKADWVACWPSKAVKLNAATGQVNLHYNLKIT